MGIYLTDSLDNPLQNGPELRPFPKSIGGSTVDQSGDIENLIIQTGLIQGVLSEKEEGLGQYGVYFRLISRGLLEQSIQPFFHGPQRSGPRVKTGLRQGPWLGAAGALNGLEKALEPIEISRQEPLVHNRRPVY